MRQEKGGKKERERELSYTIPNRKSVKFINNDDLKKRSIRLDSNFNVMNINREKEEKMLLSNASNLSNVKPVNSISIVPSTSNFFLDNPTSTTTSKVMPVSSNTSGNVSVMCRFRPLNEKEKLQSKDLCVDFKDNQEISIKSTAENNNIYKFSFDRIFDMNSTQKEVYDAAAKPIIDSVLEGFNGTIFAYGQTASGKTYTMQGVFDSPEDEGIIPRMIKNVFDNILNSSDNLEFIVKVSMIEIYMEKVRDLIDTNRSNLNIREDKAKGIYIEDLSEHYVSNEYEVLNLMKEGSENRAMAATNMNEHSSRSHSIFIMTIHQNNVKDLIAKTGKLYLVDLAGSEKISKTGATGLTLEEAKTINKSLTSLGMVINNLTDGKSQHIPYRESKLTRVLQESLGGNAKTCLIVACSPSTYNEAETVSTLRFGLRAKKIKNKPKINKEVTVAELKLEIDKLERFLVTCKKRIDQLENFITRNNLVPPSENDYSFADKEIKKDNLSLLDEELTNIRCADLSSIENDNQDEDTGLVIEEKKENLNNDMHSKYKEVINQVNSLEDDKKELNDKLEDAISKIKDFSVHIEQKERLIDEFDVLKRNFEMKEQELYEKIKELEDKLNFERNVDSKSKSTSDIGYNVDDYSNNAGNISIISDSENINPHKETIDEIYSKIQSIVSNYNDKESYVNFSLNNHLNGLVTMIKNKLNYNDNFSASSLLNDTNSIIERNADFEICKCTFNAASPTENNSVLHTSSASDEVMRKEKKKFENEKKIILKALEEKSDKISQLDNDNRELKERMKLLESKMNPDDKNYVKKIISLEKNLEQVNLMYHQVVTQKSVLKIENQVLEKKIKKRNEKLVVIEKDNSDLKKDLKNAKDKLAMYQKSYVTKPASVSNNVVKVIKGGHATKGSTVLNGDILITMTDIQEN